MGFVSVFFPITAAFFLAHPLWGWAGLAALVSVFPATNAVLVSRAVSQASASLERIHDGDIAVLERQHRDREIDLTRRIEALDREYRAKDIALLRDWTAGCGSSSRFFGLLADGISHEHLPLWFLRQLEEMVERWARDSRDIQDSLLRRAWETMKSSATAYADSINCYMQVKERRPDALEIPSAWEQDEGAEYKNTLTELQSNRAALERSLREVHRLVYAG